MHLNVHLRVGSFNWSQSRLTYRSFHIIRKSCSNCWGFQLLLNVARWNFSSFSRCGSCDTFLGHFHQGLVIYGCFYWRPSRKMLWIILVSRFLNISFLILAFLFFLHIFLSSVFVVNLLVVTYRYWPIFEHRNGPFTMARSEGSVLVLVDVLIIHRS